MYKKIILGIGAGTLISSNAFAGYITPEIKRDGKELNKSAVAVSLQQNRRGLGVAYTDTTTENTAAKVSGDALIPYAFYSSEVFSTELRITAGESDSDALLNDETSLDAYTLYAGLRAPINLTFGVGAINSETDYRTGGFKTGGTNTDGMDIGLGYQHNNIYMGLGVELLEQEVYSNATGSATADETTTYLGIGMQNIDDENNSANSFEFVYRQTTGEVNGPSLVPDNDEFIFAGTFARGITEVDAALLFGESELLGVTTDNFRVDLEVEILLGSNSNFYLTPGISYADIDASGASSESTYPSLAFGYRRDNMDVDLTYTSGTTDMDSSILGDTDTDIIKIDFVWLY